LKAEEILKQYWGYDSFRGIQREIIDSVMAGRDTLGLMPTGGGKSICFQVPVMAMEGLCIVITPLVALMKDQVSQLRMRGIKAAAVHSGMRHDEQLRMLDNCVLGNYKFLYISPERISTELFQAKIRHAARICLITIDEAHCISQWGYDFRPSYLQVAKIRHMFPYHIPVLALTATATPKVVDDIQERLEFKEKNVFSMSFERKNIRYIVRHTDNKPDEIVHILQSVPQGSAIVYTRNRKLTTDLARYLNEHDISADNFHAGLSEAEKDFRQESWTRGQTRVMVATNAFGMGIDKPDVRLVIHYSSPDSIESYYQEAGRAGRDGNTAYAILLYNPADKQTIMQRVAQTYPERDYILQTYDNVCYFLQIAEGDGMGHTYDFCMEMFCKSFRQFALHTNSALQILSNAGYIEYHEQQDFKSRLMFTVRKEDLYRINEGGPEADTLMRTLLRTYTGLFADHVFIEETFLARTTGIPAEKIYLMLKEMARRRIISCIPKRSTPTITFLTPRAESRYLNIPRSIYEDRKESFKQRLDTIIDYLTSNDKCRSQIMLEYFGQKSAPLCQQCDVCIAHKKKSASKEDEANNIVRSKIIEALSDGQFHPITDLNKIRNVARERIDSVLRHMAEEEEIEMNLSKIRLTPGQE
jgi:ATP-dependent DNA helicase RecQ